jgi:hypothetical protein
VAGPRIVNQPPPPIASGAWLSARSALRRCTYDPGLRISVKQITYLTACDPCRGKRALLARGALDEIGEPFELEMLERVVMAAIARSGTNG